MSDDLPEGWARASLVEVCQLNPPKPPRDFLPPDADVTFVPMPAVDAESGTVAAPEIRPFAKVRNGHPAFRDGDVIMAKITPCMENGKAAVVRGLKNGVGFGSTEFHVLRPTPAVLAEYVYHFIRQESFRDAAAAEMTGSVGQKRVPADFLKQVVLPLPPLAEQHRIVAKLEALLARVTAARQRLAKVPAILKRFRGSVLEAACSGRLTGDRSEGSHDLRKNWKAVALSELLDEIFDGPFGSNLKTADYTESGVRVIRLENIGQLQFISSKRTFIAHEKYGQLKKHTVAGGDIIFGSFIDGETRVCVLPELETDAIAKADCFCLRAKANVVDRVFLVYQLACRRTHEVLMEDIHGATRPRINIRQLKQVTIPVCPLAEQHEIARRVEALFRLADAIEKRVAAATARAEKVTEAVLERAFRGALVPTEADLARREGREYEPAAMLLERIRHPSKTDGNEETHSARIELRAGKASPRKTR